jgi:hypothetical protein
MHDISKYVIDPIVHRYHTTASLPDLDSAQHADSTYNASAQ